MIAASYSYRGYRCRGKGFHVAVSAFSGLVESFGESPVVPPDSLVVDLTDDEAVAVAKAFVRLRFGPETDTFKFEAKLQIEELDSEAERASLSESKVEGFRTRLCWALRILTDSDGVVGTVTIDAETGEILEHFL